MPPDIEARPAETDPQAYVAGNSVVQTAPLVPEIKLHLADERAPLWNKTQRDLWDDGIVLPYWAFAWAGGQALARLLLDEPERVRGKRVLDFASGSAISGIAAKLSGATHVLAADIDPLAAVAAQMNADANAITLDTSTDDLVGQSLAGFDVIIAGDICYEQSVAERVRDWLGEEAHAGREVLIGDPGRTFLPRKDLEPVIGYGVKSARDLDDTDVRNARVWRFAAG
ncbi:50S ribosomal protein L11 methyltransferase [Pyruvatibacter sp.]|uniref:class I SAM-dependent methyltransferase n=1 Tax=Pyruvatibacter sp. TaxID=1981328 RepID=UPI003265A914